MLASQIDLSHAELIELFQVPILKFIWQESE
jgi:hypothetical protein